MKSQLRPKNNRIGRINRRVEMIKARTKLTAAKGRLAREKGKTRSAVLEENAKRGGIRGAISRKLLEKQAKSQAKAENYKNAAKVREADKAREFKLAQTKARGRAIVGATSALGGAQAIKTEAEKDASIAASKAREKVAEAYTKSLQGINGPDDTTNSVSGVTQGVL